MNKFTATYDRHTFKRASANRTYTHTVISVEVIAQMRIGIETWARKSFKDNFEYRTAIAKGGIYDYGRGLRHPITTQEQAAAQAALDLGVDGTVAEALARFDASRFLRSADGTKSYRNLGWCGRLDLAHKLAAKYPGSVIVEAVRS